MKLSDNERTVLSEFNDSATKFSLKDGIAAGSGMYQSDFVTKVSEHLSIAERSAKGVASSLVKKGIFDSEQTAIDDEGHERDHWMTLTEAGVEVLADLRIEEDEAMLDLDEEDDEPEVKIQTKSIAAMEADKRIKAYREETKEMREAARADIKEGKPNMRTSHANCDHATQGKEGKIARAKCRRERAAALTALEKEKVDA